MGIVSGKLNHIKRKSAEVQALVGDGATEASMVAGGPEHKVLVPFTKTTLEPGENETFRLIRTAVSYDVGMKVFGGETTYHFEDRELDWLAVSKKGYERLVYLPFEVESAVRTYINEQALGRDSDLKVSLSTITELNSSDWYVHSPRLKLAGTFSPEEEDKIRLSYKWGFSKGALTLSQFVRNTTAVLGERRVLPSREKLGLRPKLGEPRR